jgi:hypothetical protein
VHGPREVKLSGGEFYFANLMVAGRCLARQGERQSVVSPGQLWVVDTRVPYFLDFESQWRMFTFRIPHKLLSPRLSNPGQGTVMPIDGGSGIGSLAAAMMRSMWKLEEPGFGARAVELEQSFAAVVSAALGARDRGESAQDALRADVRFHRDCCTGCSKGRSTRSRRPYGRCGWTSVPGCWPTP